MQLSERLEQYNKFRSFLGPNVWRLFIMSLFVGLCWFVVEFSFIYVLQAFFHAIGLVSRTQLFLPEWYPQGLIPAIVFLISFGILRSLVLVGKTILGGLISQTFVRDQREKIIKLAFLGDKPVNTPEVIAHFTDRIVQSGAFIQTVAQLILGAVMIILLSGAGVWLAPQEFITGALFFSIFVIPLNSLNKKISSVALGIHEDWKKVTQTLIFGIRNSFLLKIYHRRHNEAQKGSDILNKSLRHFFDYYRILSLKGVLPNIIGIVGISLITYISLHFFETSAMKLISLYYIFIRLAQNVSELGTYTADLKMYLPNFKYLYNFLRTPTPEIKAPEIKNKSPLAHLPNLTLEMKDVNFSYASGRPLFKNFSLRIQTGQILLIKGESGSGKSTLLSLLTGILQPQGGDVFCNEISIGELKSDFADIIGYVGPESYLLPGTVRENLLYPDYKESITDATLWAALEQSFIADAIKGFPMGLYENLNEDTQLSTGQKQRLALARALVRNPKILILDEATSNLDIETEYKIMNLLLKQKNQMLTVIVSHRDTFDKSADEILNLG